MTSHDNWYKAQEKRGAVVIFGNVQLPVYRDADDKEIGELIVDKDGSSAIFYHSPQFANSSRLDQEETLEKLAMTLLSANPQSCFKVPSQEFFAQSGVRLRDDQYGHFAFKLAYLLGKLRELDRTKRYESDMTLSRHLDLQWADETYEGNILTFTYDAKWELPERDLVSFFKQGLRSNGITFNLEVDKWREQRRQVPSLREQELNNGHAARIRFQEKPLGIKEEVEVDWDAVERRKRAESMHGPYRW